MDQAWLLWVGAAILFGILEVVLPYFAFIFASFAALFASIVALRTSVWEIPFAAFTFGLLGLIFMVRPRVVKIWQARTHIPSRAEQLFGKRGRVIEAIDTPSGKGRVEVEGSDWAAKSSTPLSVGAEIVVESADGIVLHVRKG